jgi:hypothetical protein
MLDLHIHSQIKNDFIIVFQIAMKYITKSLYNAETIAFTAKLNFKELGKLAQCIIFNTLFDCYLANLFIDK